jgi:ABC-type dipeptide/oligopeptide/nickel transport system ATPase component
VPRDSDDLSGANDGAEPAFTIGNQIIEAVQIYQPLISKMDAIDAAIELLKKTGIPEPERRFHSYPINCQADNDSVR